MIYTTIPYTECDMSRYMLILLILHIILLAMLAMFLAAIHIITKYTTASSRLSGYYHNNEVGLK